MIRINSVPGDETSIELTGNPYEAAPEIRDLFSGAIESALASVKGETAC